MKTNVMILDTSIKFRAFTFQTSPRGFSDNLDQLQSYLFDYVNFSNFCLSVHNIFCSILLYFMFMIV